MTGASAEVTPAISFPVRARSPSDSRIGGRANRPFGASRSLRRRSLLAALLARSDTRGAVVSASDPCWVLREALWSAPQTTLHFIMRRCAQLSASGSRRVLREALCSAPQTILHIIARRCLISASILDKDFARRFDQRLRYFGVQSCALNTNRISMRQQVKNCKPGTAVDFRGGIE